ncbi:tetratricopeptide repeat protein [Campylobacter sp.]|uniref:tetratricopeptide repeat protein n=1 Tax=Campylobacter sp. TaxID=205 RepID=UPI002A4ED11A|nr:tetratricopeptide repeat protein [Campylobacter sp.]MDD7091536.1 tetratricopeptide repeat protein [Campylobacteraceae bacterium]MDY5285886.1 tetratricopeptide repeat protein [Campylobacter sp.]
MKKSLIVVLAVFSLVNAEQISIGGTSFERVDALEAYEVGCASNDSEACFEAGWIHYQRQNLNKAIELYTKACNANNYKACTNLGALYFGGEGVKVDIKKAKELFSKACELGDGDGCNNTAFLYEQEKDIKTALKLYKKACDLGHQIACGAYKELSK